MTNYYYSPFMLPLDIAVDFDRRPDGALIPTCTLSASVIACTIAAYWRWCGEGKPPYGADGKPGMRQDYYDNYHQRVAWNAEQQCYAFSIHISDSPQGDQWLIGTCKLEGPVINIINQRTVTQ